MMEPGLGPRPTLMPGGGFRAWLAACLPVLTVTFGLQMLRALLPVPLFGLRHLLEWDPAHVVVLAGVALPLAVLFWAVYRLRRTGHVLALSAGGVGLLRLAMQMWQGDTLADWCLSLAGMALAGIFLFAYSRHTLTKDVGAPVHVGLALLLALYLDAVVFGAFGTWAPFWRQGEVALAVVAVLVAVQLLALVAAPRLPRMSEAEGVSVPGGTWRGHALLMVALGALLFLQLQLLCPLLLLCLLLLRRM